MELKHLLQNITKLSAVTQALSEPCHSLAD